MITAVGFKEWQVVCDSLGSGRQTLIFRKGGIHESRNGFSFAHSSFFLFPTRFHATPNEVCEGIMSELAEWQPGEMVEITHHAEAISAVTLTDWNDVVKLTPHHIYSEKTIRDRFDWEGKGMVTGSIHVALVRVRKLQEPWIFPYESKYGGCRSWINLPSPPDDWYQSSVPVLNDAEFFAVEENSYHSVTRHS